MKIVIPGDLLPFQPGQVLVGPGVYTQNSLLYASLFGEQLLDLKTTPPTLSVKHFKNSQDSTSIILPKVSDIVIGIVTKIEPRKATLEIHLVNSSLCMNSTFKGIIRSQDVRSTDKDNVQMHLSFRPGDVVRAEVISLGDASAYYLSTAKNELGVLAAKSAAGENMIPISWEEMMCPKTRVKEYRKCAKPNFD